jgi:hypothetical protein
MAHPTKIRVLAEAKVKTDRIDSRIRWVRLMLECKSGLPRINPTHEAAGFY